MAVGADMFYRRASGGRYERAENSSSACDGLVEFTLVPKCSNFIEMGISDEEERRNHVQRSTVGVVKGPDPKSVP